MQHEEQVGKIRNALVSAVAVLVVLVLSFVLAHILVANGEHAGERCLPPSAPGAQLQDYQGHLFTLTVTCSFKTPDGNVIEKEEDLF